MRDKGELMAIIVETERVSMNPTLPVLAAIKGIALEKMSEQKPGNVSKDYANYKGDPLVECFLRQFINHLPFGPGIGSYTSLYMERSI